MIVFKESVPIDSIKGARYNPRKIDQASLDALRESIKLFGMIKPLIVNSGNGVIVAGHQRKKACELIGIQTVPCIFIDSPGQQDEILFNLMHNSIETSDTHVWLGEYFLGEYRYCPNNLIKIKSHVGNVCVSGEIAKLLSKYGEWGSVVVDEDGQVILNAEYAYCAKQMGYGVLCYCVANEKKQRFSEYMGKEYGHYTFDNLGIKTYHQFNAQPRRLTTDGSKANYSVLYEKYVIPQMKQDKSLIDVGAGRMAYVKQLQSAGFPAHGYEPALMTKGNRSIDIKGIVKCILNLERHVLTHGLFDVCV